MAIVRSETMHASIEDAIEAVDRAGVDYGMNSWGAKEEVLACERRKQAVEALRAAIRAEFACIATSHVSPIDMVLHCPRCHLQHVDAPEPDKGWTNPSHKSHLCHGCSWVWRPADVATNGVAAIKTRGEHDSVKRVTRSPGWCHRCRAQAKYTCDHDGCPRSMCELHMNPAGKLHACGDHLRAMLPEACGCDDKDASVCIARHTAGETAPCECACHGTSDADPFVLEHARCLEDTSACVPWCLACRMDEARARIREAMDKALNVKLSPESFCEFMDAVAPGWRRERVASARALRTVIDAARDTAPAGAS